MKKTVEKLEALPELGGIRKDIVLLAISAAALAVSIFKPFPLPFDAAWVAIILCGLPIIAEAFCGLVSSFDIKADVLVSMALIAAVCIGEDFAAGEVAFIMQLGALLEDLTVARARAGIERLVRLTPQTARVVSGDTLKIISAQEVKIGDILRVLPGETIPADGVIISGSTSVNQAVMTGESMPADKSVGDEVSSGTVNQFGAFDMRAARVGEDSSIQRMIRLVKSADAGKAKIVGIADRRATWIVLLALTAAVLTLIITRQPIRAVTILVVFCPCALVLATSIAIMAAIGNATKHGFLVRDGGALERLARVQKVTFDKTGTLTYGTPEVVGVHSAAAEISDDELYALCAAGKAMSEHPLGKAVAGCFRRDTQKEPERAEGFNMIPGRGISAVVSGRKILAGNLAMLNDEKIVLPPDTAAKIKEFTDRGCSVIYVAADGAFAGFLALSDTVRPESVRVIDALHKLGVRPVLLTGDHAEAARSVAIRLHIREVHSGCLPEDKLGYIKSACAEKQSVCMIGDGINDAPALKAADVGIAMGGVGSDIAVDASDIVLVNDEVSELPHLIALARRMMRTIKINMTFSMTLNIVAVILAIYGSLSPVAGALVHNAGSVLVIASSALLLKWR